MINRCAGSCPVAEGGALVGTLVGEDLRIDLRMGPAQPAVIVVLERAVIGPMRPLENAVSVVSARFRLPCIAGMQVLLSDHGAVVTGIRKCSREHCLVSGQRHTVCIKAVIGHVLPGEKRGPGRAARPDSARSSS